MFLKLLVFSIFLGLTQGHEQSTNNTTQKKQLSEVDWKNELILFMRNQSKVVNLRELIQAFRVLNKTKQIIDRAGNQSKDSKIPINFNWVSSIFNNVVEFERQFIHALGDFANATFVGFFDTVAAAANILIPFKNQTNKI